MEEFYEIIQDLNGAMVVCPASEEDIKEIIEDLQDNDMPSLPEDYIEFLKNCNGFAFNGVELFGTDIVTDTESGFQLIDIVSFNIEQQSLFEDYLIDFDLLFFGRVDDDIYTFDVQNSVYQVRDITSFDVWDEYSDFDDFISTEVVCKYIDNDFSEDDNGQFDSWS